MKTMLGILWLYGAANLCAITLRAATTDMNFPPRLTVELRDGSRVVGTSREDYFKFNSALLGEVKLAVKDIRSVDCTSTNTAKLTTVNGDGLTVSITGAAFKLKTGFGPVELAAHSVRRISVTSPGRLNPNRPGLVALWSGEGNVKDSVGGNDGSLLGDSGYGSGLFGRAFQFSPPAAAVKIPAAPVLDVGKGSGFTLEAWINPSDVSQAHPIFEWNNADYWGVHFHIAPGQPFNVTTGPGELYANIPDEHGTWHQLSSPAGVVAANQFQLVTLTYDRATGEAMISCNGQVVGRQNLGRFTPLTRYDLYLGRRPAPAAEACSFAGLIDEAAIYNRALTDAEILEDYAAGRLN